jgi:hypothetical protein
MDGNKNMMPLETLEAILKDDDIFRKFVVNFSKSKDIFKNFTIEDYIEYLNILMKYYLKNDKNLPKKYFEKINYINSYYKNIVSNTTEYNYEEYLEYEKPNISLSTLNAIVSDEETYQKFLHFYDFKDFFNNIPLEEYIAALENMEKYYYDNNIKLQNRKIDRINNIKSNFIFNIDHFEKLDGIKFEGLVEESLENEIFKRINMDDDDFGKARSIYVELCKLVTYDETFLAYRQKKLNLGYIKNKNYAKTFAEIYTSLLNKLGIEAVIRGDLHKYTLFLYNGVVIKADGTKTKNESNEHIMCDTTRVKIGLKTVGFETLNPEYDIHIAIEASDKKHNEYQERLKEYKTNLEKKYWLLRKDLPQVSNIDEAMDYVSRLSLNQYLSGIDYIKYMELMLLANLKFSEQKDISFVTCYKKQDENFNSVLVADLSSYYDNEDTYYLFEEKKGASILSSMDLRSMKDRGVLSIPSKKFEKNLEDKKGWNY